MIHVPLLFGGRVMMVCSPSKTDFFPQCSRLLRQHRPPFAVGAPIAPSNTQSGGCMWPCTTLQDTSNRSRLWQITVFTWGRFSSKPVLFYRNLRDVGAFKHYCISRYIQESALFSCFAVRFTGDTRSPDNSSACSLHPPPSEKSLLLLRNRSSALGCLRPLIVFYFQRLLL